MLPAYDLPPASAPKGEDASLLPQSAEDQKRSFLRMVSHELRTPLNSILGFSEILASELYGPLGAPQYREYAHIIRGSGQKLLKLVNQVLEIARLQGGTHDLTPRPEPLSPILEDVAWSVREEYDERGLQLTVSGGEGVSVLADPRGLKTILGALLQNALTFSPDGGEVRILASAQRELVEIVVANDGDGIEASELARLMRPFEQGENALTRHTEGAGLGLPICDLTCRAMGGMLKLASAPGKGFSAHVILRAA
jgi:signal transduction histidine kinase